jgi:hypothetical protein
MSLIGTLLGYALTATAVFVVALILRSIAFSL